MQFASALLFPQNGLRSGLRSVPRETGRGRARKMRDKREKSRGNLFPYRRGRGIIEKEVGNIRIPGLSFGEQALNFGRISVE